jgi:TRAP transporter TAXI family solute receptor
MTIINEHVPGVKATAIASGALANLRMMLAGEMLMQLWINASSGAIYAGPTDMFDEAQPQIRWVSTAHGTWLFFITLDPDIKTLYDIKGKKIAMGGPGTIDITYCETVLGAIGLERDVDYEGVLLDGFEAGDALMDGRVDVKYASGGMNTPSIAEVDAMKNTYFLPYPEDQWDAIMGAMKDAGLAQARGTIPQDQYNGLTEDYDTMVGLCGWFTYEAADEELIYKITKGLWENIDMMPLVHSAGAEFSLEHVKQGMDLPIHPGALRYYKEIGVLTEDPFKG